MNREPNFEGGGDTARDEFDAIVATWQAEGNVPEWPTQPAPAVTDAPEPPTRPQPVVEDPVVDEHYVPPEPPPLPRIGPPAVVGAVLLALGLVLVVAPGWLGLSSVYGLPLGLISLAAGLGWLVLRLWPDATSATPPDDGDDGAVI